jgi:hypothetical protein
MKQFTKKQMIEFAKHCRSKSILLMEAINIEDELDLWNKKNTIMNEIFNSNIGKKFREAEIDQITNDYEDEFEY